MSTKVNLMMFGLSTKALGALGGAVVLIGVVAGTAAVLADSDDYGTIDAPAWESGYKWAYDVSGSFDYAINVPGEITDSASSTFGPFSIKKEILNVNDFQNEGEQIYLGAATLPLGHILDMGMFYVDDWADLAVFPTADRQRDLAPTLVWPDYECNGYDCDATDLNFGANTGLDYIQFPLTYGKQWSDSVELADELGLDAMELDGAGMEGITEIKMIGEAGKMEMLDLPIGPTEAIRLDFSYQPVGLQKVIAEMREEVEGYGVNVERLNVQIGLHEIAHYSPDYQAIVQDQFVARFLVDAAFTFQGDRIEVFSEASAYTVAKLTGAELVEVPDRSMSEILDILNGKNPIKDVQGQTVSTLAPYAVDLLADRTVVNAANGESARFQIDVDGEGLPAGHSLEYVLLDYAGEVVDRQQTGSEFLIQFNEPGSYTLLAGAFDEEGRLIAQDGTTITANYHKSLGVTCDTLDGYFVPCGETNIPLRGGLQHVFLRATVNETLPDAGILGKRIELRDSANQVYLGYGQGNGVYQIELAGHDVAIAGKDAMLSYRPVVGTMETLEFEIILDYGAQPEVAGLSSSSSVGLQSVMQDWHVIGFMMKSADAALQDLVAGNVPTADAMGLLYLA